MTIILPLESLVSPKSIDDIQLNPDLRGLPDLKFDFDLGKPFTPYQQLMGVLPEESKEHVPAAYRVSQSLGTGIKTDH